MKVTIEQVIKAIDRAIADQENNLSASVLKQDWREAAERDVYLSGLRYAKELVNMLRIEDD